MHLSKAWNAKLEAASFLLSKILYKQCELCLNEVNLYKPGIQLLNSEFVSDLDFSFSNPGSDLIFSFSNPGLFEFQV